MTGQLQLDGDLLAQVAEPGMTATELEAVIRDALGELRARPCRCSSPMVLLDVLAFDEFRCLKCGREPRRA